MHVFVAGGAGYIGSVLVPILLDRGHRVTVLDRLYFGNSLAKLAGKAEVPLTVVRGDVRSFEHALLARVEAIVDLCGLSNDLSCELDPGLTRSVCVDGARRLALLAREAGVARYVYSSSCSVYGRGERLGLDETIAPRPLSLYARAKVEVERFLFELGIASRGGFSPVVLRLATVFGLSPRMRLDLAVNVMTKDAHVARRIMVDGDGRQWRPFAHVRDVARAFCLALEADPKIVAGETFNIGSDAANLQILSLAFRVRDAVPGAEVVYARTEPDSRDYNIAFDKAQRVLGFHAEHGIDSGIREVLTALRDGQINPEERRWYTVRQYVFLREAERALADLAIDGKLLAGSADRRDDRSEGGTR